MDDGSTMYERVGGRAFFAQLVDSFYEGVAADPVLAPLYPEYPDFTGARHRLTLFLVQYWGGPTDYSAERGHPALRMRHLRFSIGTDERDRWLAHMADAVATATRDLEGGEVIAAELLDYFRPTAEHLRNDTGLPITSTSFRT
jgi:hemoglobin